MTINYIVTFCFLGQSRGDSFDQVQSGREWHTIYPVHTVCRKPGLSICSCSYSRIRHVLYSTLPFSPLQYHHLLRHKEWGKTGASLTCLHSQTRWRRTDAPFCSRFMCSQDCTSAFKGKVKVAPLKKFMKTPRFYASFLYFFTFVLSRT